MKALKALVTITSVLTSLTVSHGAAACSRSPCTGAYPAPSSGNRPAFLPANVTVLGLFPGSTTQVPAAGDLRLRRTDREELIPITVVDARATLNLWLLRLDRPLSAPSTYELTTASLCPQPAGSVPAEAITTGFQVTSEAPMPAALGTVTLAAPVVETSFIPPNIDLPTCGAQGTIVRRDAILRFDASAEPWRNLLRVQLYVDGAPVGAARVGESRLTTASRYDDLGLPYTVCDGTAAARALGLTQGNHRFEFRGRVLGSEVELRTPVLEGRLDCPGAAPAAGGDEGGVSCAASPRRGVGGSAALLALLGVSVALRRRLARASR